MKKEAFDLAKKYIESPDFDLTQGIAKVASKHRWNAHKVAHCVHQVNRHIITSLQKGIPTGDVDPHFTFDQVKVASVISAMTNPSQLMRMPRLPRKKSVIIEKSIASDPPLVVQLNEIEKRISKKIDKLYRMKLKIEELQEKMCTKVANVLVQGTPVEVIRSLPVETEGVIDRISKVAELHHIDEEFELDENHELVKLAYQIQSMQNETNGLETYIKTLEEKRDGIKDKYIKGRS